MLQSIFTAFLDLLFPKYCICCLKIGRYLCSDCVSQIAFVRTQECPRCRRDDSKGSTCLRCREGYFLDGLIVLARYDPKIMKKMIAQFKYKYSTELGSFFGGFLWEKVFCRRSELQDCYLVPVPTTATRLRERGFNQTLVLVNEVKKRAPPLFSILDCLRKKGAKRQAGLGKSERLKNSKDLYTVSHLTKERLVDQNFILIDDVATTTTTLNECARTLKLAGAKSVIGVVLARSQRYHVNHKY